jgi:Ala-tRNA(Pro) deacylase
MPVKRLKDALDAQGIKYMLISHSPAYTAQEIAASAHIPGKEMAKTVIVRVDGRLMMVLLPASRQIDFQRLQEGLSATTAELASEEEFKGLCPDCELGAMPPFGPLYGVQVVVDGALALDEEIYFNAGSHRELLKMSFADFAKSVQPKIVMLSK